MSDVSVIIVSWNAREHLRSCLNSLRATGAPIVREVIVVENGSTDGSPERVARDFPEVALVQLAQNLGFARANNLGIKQAAGSYLALINSDVIVHPQCLQTLGGFLAANPQVGLVGPKVLGADGKLQRSCKLLPGTWKLVCQTFGIDKLLWRWPLFAGREMRYWSQEELAEVEMLTGCFWMARKQAVNKVGLLDERFFFYGEDVDWCKRFRDSGWSIFFLPEAVATHYGGASSENAPLVYTVHMLRANLAYWRKHHGIPGWLTCYVLLTLHFGIRAALLKFVSLLSSARRAATSRKFQENFVSFRWLLSRKEV